MSITFKELCKKSLRAGAKTISDVISCIEIGSDMYNAFARYIDEDLTAFPISFNTPLEKGIKQMDILDNATFAMNNPKVIVDNDKIRIKTVGNNSEIVAYVKNKTDRNVLLGFDCDCFIDDFKIKANEETEITLTDESMKYLTAFIGDSYSITPTWCY